jgi:hypothetical protein
VQKQLRRTCQATLPFALVALAGCVTSASLKTDDLRAVDSLIGRIERVYVESEVSKQRVNAAVAALQVLSAPDFSGDPVAAYEAFLVSIESSDKQEEVLSNTVASMEKDAKSVFASWEKDLDSFKSPELRRRSAARLEDTRANYADILAVVRPVQTAYEELNAALHDHSLFLGHDFNRAAVQDLKPDTANLVAQAEELETALDHCMTRTSGYVESKALPGQLEKPVEQRDRKAGG